MLKAWEKEKRENVRPRSILFERKLSTEKRERAEVNVKNLSYEKEILRD